MCIMDAWQALPWPGGWVAAIIGPGFPTDGESVWGVGSPGYALQATNMGAYTVWGTKEAWGTYTDDIGTYWLIPVQLIHKNYN